MISNHETIIKFFTALDKKTKATILKKSPSFCFELNKNTIDSFVEKTFSSGQQGLVTKGIGANKNVYSKTTPCLVFDKNSNPNECDMVLKMGYVDIANLPKISFQEYLSMLFQFDEKVLKKINDQYIKHIKDDVYCHLIPDDFKFFSF